MDTDAGQSGQSTHGEGALLTLPEAGKRLNRSPKTVRRYIKDGRFPPEAVQTVQGPYGLEYRVSADAVGTLAAELSRGAMVPLDTGDKHLERKGLLSPQALQQIGDTVQGVVQASVQGAVQGLQDAQTTQIEQIGEQVRDALAAQQAAAEAREAALLAELRELRAELQAERERRRPWWPRLFGSSTGGGDRG